MGLNIQIYFLAAYFNYSFFKMRTRSGVASQASTVKLSKIYYSPGGYWKGNSAFSKLADAAGVSENEAKEWLKKQALWQIYLPSPR